MAYTSKAEMMDRFGEGELINLTDRASPPIGIIDDNVLDRALADADAEIDGYLQARYSLPLAGTPRSLGLLAAEIARYRLYDDHAPDHIVDRYKSAVRSLEQIAKGVIKLGLDAAQAATPATATPQTDADDPIFSAASLRGYH